MHSGGWRAAVVAVMSVAMISSCSSTSDDATKADGTSGTTTSTAPPVVRPDGPSADLSEEIADGPKAFVAAGDAESEKAAGYEQHEYIAAGTAVSYMAVGELGTDGRWQFEPGGSAGYRTRIVVRRPTDPTAFHGTVVLEWLNVSGGLDADPEWTSAHEEIVRNGDAWVGVSAQQIGVMGGPILVEAPGGEGIAGKGLKAIDPARYSSLSHPGDGFSFDMFTQIARALRAGGAPLGGASPARILAAGESQSAFALTTYANGVQPLSHQFDGFLIHSRGKTGLPLVPPGADADLATALTSPAEAATFRTDLEVPVLDVQSESDVLAPLNSYSARQPDSDTFRLWEVAGTAHADAHLLGPVPLAGIDCGVPVNNGPLHLVVKAALRALERWVTTGEAPPIAPRLEITTDTPMAISRNPDGIAIGGIRTPLVDVPVAVVSGAPGPSTSVICLLLGSTTPFDATKLGARYPSRAEYLDQYGASADTAISSGFVLEDDRAALMAYADPTGLT